MLGGGGGGLLPILFIFFFKIYLNLKYGSVFCFRILGDLGMLADPLFYAGSGGRHAPPENFKKSTLHKVGMYRLRRRRWEWATH